MAGPAAYRRRGAGRRTQRSAPPGKGPAGRGGGRLRGPPSDPIVLASGNLGLVAFPDIAGRATLEEIAGRCPRLLPALTGHPGIGFVLVRSEQRGPLVLGPGGSEHELATGRVTGRDPLAWFGPDAAAAVLRADSFAHTADLMVNSAVDPLSGAVHAFEEQAGSHGGLGGPQSRPFLLAPAELPLPAEPIVGAETLHTVFRTWLTPGLCPEPAPAVARPRNRRGLSRTSARP